ncbi:MAG: DUF4340 domain-containing protein [Planctomycetes bacterium]|nr:DUF4340 domain-containing protein [Planctomycetota bacterium]
MNKRTAIVFVAAALAVGIAVYFESRHGGNSDKPKEESVEVFPFPGEEVRKIEWKRPDGEVVAEKRGELWWLVKPRELMANQVAIVEMLTNQVHSATAARRLPKGQQPDAKVHGLDTPGLVMVLSKADGTRAQVAFGLPLGGVRSVFVRVGDSAETLTLDDYVLLAFDKPFQALRDRGLCRVGPDYFEKASSVRGGVQSSVRRQGQAWRLEGAVDDFAGQKEFLDWLTALARVETGGWETKSRESRIEYGLDPAHAILEVTSTERTIKVTVGGETEPGSGKRWVEVSDFPTEIATVKAADVDTLVMDAEKLRATRAFPFPLQTANFYAAKGPGGLDVEAEKKDDKWKLVRPVVEVSRFFAGRGEEILKELSQLGISQRLPVADPPAESITITIGWGEGDKAVRHTAQVWGDANVARFLFRDPDRLIEISTCSSWDHIRAGEAFYKNPLIYEDLMALQLQRVVVQDEKGAELDLHFDGRAWTLAVPVPGKQLDVAVMPQFSSLVAELMADTWVRGDPKDPAFGLEKPLWRLQIEPNPAKIKDASARIVIIGAPGPRETHYAQLEGTGGVFLVNAELMGVLKRGLLK